MGDRMMGGRMMGDRMMGDRVAVSVVTRSSGGASSTWRHRVRAAVRL